MTPTRRGRPEGAESGRPGAGEETSSLCLVAWVFGSHVRYVPYYVYSALSAYPEYRVRIYHEEELPPGVLESVDMIARSVSPHFELRLWDEPLPIPDGLSWRVDLRTIRRYLLPARELEGFDYAYFGDCDMFFLPETPSLLEFHQQQMRLFGLPFSNCVRRDAAGNYTRRLTGLHCVEVDRYYDVLGVEIERLRASPARLESYLQDLVWDEEFLYRLVANGFDLGRLEVGECRRPWHGLHLGAARKRRPGRQTERSFAANSLLSIEECRSLVEERLRDPVLRRILRLSPDQSFLNYLQFLGVRSGHADVRGLRARHRLGAVLKDLKQSLWS